MENARHKDCLQTLHLERWQNSKNLDKLLQSLEWKDFNAAVEASVQIN